MGTKIKWDVTSSDPEDAKGDYIEPPKPGVYRCKVISIVSGFKKSDKGTPDKTSPRLEIVVQVDDKKKAGKSQGARLYDYIAFSEVSAWKMDQFLQAFGIATKKKRKGSFDTDDIVGQYVLVRVKADSWGGEYSAKVGAYIALDEDVDEDEDEDDEDDEDEDDDEEDDEDSDDDDSDEEDEDDEEDDEEEEEPPAKGKGKGKAKPEPKKAEPKKGKGKKDPEPEEDEDDEDEDDDEEDEEPDYSSMNEKELLAEIKERGLKAKKGAKKKDLIKILEADDEDEPF